MQVDGEFSVDAPRGRVWEFFLNPHELSKSITDPHSFEVVDENNFKGSIKAGVAFIRGTFTGSVTILERTPPEHVRLKAHAAGMGSAFDIDATVKFAESGGRTSVRYLADVALNGTIASVGARLLRGTIDKKTNEFFENVRKQLASS